MQRGLLGFLVICAMKAISLSTNLEGLSSCLWSPFCVTFSPMFCCSEGGTGGAAQSAQHATRADSWTVVNELDVCMNWTVLTRLQRNTCCFKHVGDLSRMLQFGSLKGCGVDCLLKSPVAWVTLAYIYQVSHALDALVFSKCSVNI